MAPRSVRIEPRASELQNVYATVLANFLFALLEVSQPFLSVCSHALFILKKSQSPRIERAWLNSDLKVGRLPANVGISLDSGMWTESQGPWSQLLLRVTFCSWVFSRDSS